MDRTKRELETLVASQKEQLTRYEKRLKDVVTAYKGLLKEKEALDTSLAALSNAPSNNKDVSPDETDQSSISTKNADIKDEKTNEITDNVSIASNDSLLQTQILTLMNSLATLSAEKSRMEASFQTDKKQLRAQLTQKDQNISDLQTKIKQGNERAKAEVDEVKAKWIIERQEREKETSNQMLMIREIQKLYADERHLKENIEMQLNNFKTQFACNEAENPRIRDLQAQLKEARVQLKQLQGNNKSDAEAELDSAAILKQVQQEMQQLKEQHAIAIKNEQKRALIAEEQSRKQAALHEDRVANLEARLAELSSTVGSYDRLRQQDQESIHCLKKKLHELERSNSIDNDSDKSSEHRIVLQPSYDLSAIVEEILNLKKLLINENARTSNPIDLSKIFIVNTDHLRCQEDLQAVQKQYEACKLDLATLEERYQVQKSHINTLQEKVKVLNRNIDEQELELKEKSEKIRKIVQEERVKWKVTINEMENDFRCKVNDLEQQLQKQRQRSLQLLDEKEQEIKILQTSFEVFNNATSQATNLALLSAHRNDEHINDIAAASSDAESVDGIAGDNNITRKKTKLKSKKLSAGENCHIIHYANELARKDIEIVGLRKGKYAAETSLRKAIQEKVNAQEELCDKIALLEEQVDRLERCKTREGANLEYLKNVIISFMITRDPEGKRHMMNAISAVLQFTPNEIQTINAAFHKK